MLEEPGQIAGQGVEIIAAAGSVGTPMPAPVIGDGAQAMMDEMGHLIVPGIGIEDIGVHEDHRPSPAPILVEKAYAAAGLEVGHVSAPVIAVGAQGLPDRDIAGSAKECRKRLMPGPAIGTLKLDRHDVLMALPG